ncbi:VPLPA-CTERM sorting domain-containing protein [Methylomagnum sp.]
MQFKSFALPASAFLVMLGVPSLSQAVAVAPNFSIAGIPPPGFQHFDNAAKIVLTKTSPTSYVMTANWASGTFLFQSDPWTANNVTGGSYNVTANFGAGGGFVSGTVTINGNIPTYSGPGTGTPTGLLYQADLTAFGADTTNNATPSALGFKTENPTGWAAQFQPSPESVYLYGFNVASFMNGFNATKFKSVIYNNALAYTTVPIPAAAWLFGSAMAALAGWRRRNPAPH